MAKLSLSIRTLRNKPSLPAVIAMSMGVLVQPNTCGAKGLNGVCVGGDIRLQLLLEFGRFLGKGGIGVLVRDAGGIPTTPACLARIRIRDEFGTADVIPDPRTGRCLIKASDRVFLVVIKGDFAI